MDKPTNIANAPVDATHWAPETDQWLECYYRLEGGLWYRVNDYWASDIAQRPYGLPAQNWKNNGSPVLKRPTTDLIPLDKFK